MDKRSLKRAIGEEFWRESAARLPDEEAAAVLEDELDRAVARANRSGMPLGLMFIDLDGFKKVNYTEGHKAGDRLLCIIADRLQLQAAEQTGIGVDDQTLAQAIDNQATLITVDPRFSVAAGKSQYWLPIRPGTDIALLLAWMNVLINEGLYDSDYIERHALGFEQLAEHVQPFNPEWAYLETGLEPELIRTTAREMAAKAPATLVHPGRHTTWYGDDTQRERAIAILNALLGSWGSKGGFYFQEKVALPAYPTPKPPKSSSDWKQRVQGEFPFAASGRARAMQETEGMVKVLSDEDTDQVLGVHIIGTAASELIATAVMAMEFAGSSEDIARTVFAHPTLSEGIHEAALAVDERALHISHKRPR